MEFQELLPRSLQFMEALTTMVLFMHLPRHSVAQLRSELGVTTLMSLLRPNGLHMEFLGNCPSCLQLLEVLTSTVLFTNAPRQRVTQICLVLRTEFQELRPRRLQVMEVLTSTVLFMHLPRPSVAQLRSKLGVTTLMSLLRPG